VPAEDIAVQVVIAVVTSGYHLYHHYHNFMFISRGSHIRAVNLNAHYYKN
jgi:hypothetical protein